eukprot:scaffold8079_cov121-Cylindrotheca_fusiformis.AAC.4
MKASTFLLLSLATVACHGFSSQAPRFAFRWMPSSTYAKGDTRLYEVIPQEIPAKSSETAGTVIDSPKTVGNVLFVLPHNAGEIKSNFGSRSPYGSPSILEVAQQLQRKVRWFSDLLVDADIVVLPENGDYTNDLETQALESDALIALHVTDNKDIAWLQTVFNRRSQLQLPNMCHFALESDSPPPSRCGPYDSTASSSLSPKLLLPWTNSASGKRLDEQMKGLFERWTSDDFTYAIMLFFNRFSGTEIDWCKHSIDATWEKGPWRNAKEFYNMVTKCGDCVAKCVADEQCKECLDALTALDTTDQVASYRTIVSYESELLKDFSFCILQKNNIFNCDANIPQSPKVTPISEFRGKPLTKNIARGILIGHLDDDKALEGGDKISTSWKVAAGANVAYDQFPSQNQIFYETASGKGGMWYDPVFRVETVDGRNVWCKRHYRVRDGEVPGTFYFSVLDNGVTSNEFWTIVDVADDLSHIIFHYAGAAGAVGQRYLGGLLCTSDGSLPKELEEIYGKFRSAGIDPWELFIVDNSPDSPGALEAGEPPLDFFRKDVLAQKRRLQNDPE